MMMICRMRRRMRQAGYNPLQVVQIRHINEGTWIAPANASLNLTTVARKVPLFIWYDPCNIYSTVNNVINPPLTRITTNNPMLMSNSSYIRAVGDYDMMKLYSWTLIFRAPLITNTIQDGAGSASAVKNYRFRIWYRYVDNVPCIRRQQNAVTEGSTTYINDYDESQYSINQISIFNDPRWHSKTFSAGRPVKMFFKPSHSKDVGTYTSTGGGSVNGVLDPDWSCNRSWIPTEGMLQTFEANSTRVASYFGIFIFFEAMDITYATAMNTQASGWTPFIPSSFHVEHRFKFLFKNLKG